jgi:hypothetical protein
MPDFVIGRQLGELNRSIPQSLNRKSIREIRQFSKSRNRRKPGHSVNRQMAALPPSRRYMMRICKGR